MLRGVERVLLGGLSRSSFDGEVLAYVDAVAELAGRLQSRGWTDVSDVDSLVWDWPDTALLAEPAATSVLLCTSIMVVVDDEEADRFMVDLTVIGEPDELESGRAVAPAELTDDVLAQLEAYIPGDPNITVPAVGRSR